MINDKQDSVVIVYDFSIRGKSILIIFDLGFNMYYS